MNRKNNNQDINHQELDAFLCARIKKTAAEVKWVELFATLVEMATIGLLLVLIGILLDHWGVTGGLPIKGRIVALLVLLSVLVTIFSFRLYPLVCYRINPLYAAGILENVREDNKNSLINWFQLRLLFLREKGRLPIHQAVMDGVTQQAADEVIALSDETVIDHSSVIRWGISFTIIFALTLGYFVWSPKSLVVSAQRLFLPTANIAAPLAVRFVAVTPGDAVVFVGSHLTVQAEIRSATGQNVYFCWSTSDKRLIDQRLPMTLGNPHSWSLKFPPTEQGIAETIFYQIIVGDSVSTENRSATYTIEVRPPLAIQVEKMILNFPTYTGEIPITMENSGEIRAPYGTQVELFVKANAPMSKGFVQPVDEKNLREEITISAEDTSRGYFRFLLQPKNDLSISEAFSFALQDTYVLSFIDREGNESPKPSVYPVNIIVDQPPTISWEKTPPSQVKIPLNHQLRVQVRAEDPDYGLAKVEIQVNRREKQGEVGRFLLEAEKLIPPVVLFPNEKLAKNSAIVKREIVLDGVITPALLGLKEGEEYEYLAVAVDNREPEANFAYTEKKLFVVVATSSKPQVPEQEEKGTDTQNNSNEKEGDTGQESGQDGSNEMGQGAGQESGQDGNQEGANEMGQGAGQESGQDGNQEGSNEMGQGAGQESGQDGNQEGSNEMGQGAGQESGQNGGQDGSNEMGQGAGQESGQDGNQDGSNEMGQGAGQESGQNGNQEGSNEMGQGAGQESGQNGGQSGSNEDKQGSQNKSASISDSIDPESNPGDAFETMLDYMQQKSKEPPSAESSRWKGETPKELPQGLERKQGDVSMDENNFMIKETTEDQAANARPVNPNAHVVDDPDQPVAGQKGSDTAPNTPLKTDDPRRLGQSPEIAPSPPKNEQEKQNPPANKEDMFTPEDVGLDSPQLAAQVTAQSTGTPSENAATLRLPDPQKGNEKGELGPGSGSENAQTNHPSKSKEGEGGIGKNEQEAEQSDRQAKGGGSGAGDFGKGEVAALANDPNIRYTEQATNLVLEYLEDQLKEGIDRELLEKLGWSEQQLKDFLSKWLEIKKNAKKTDISSSQHVSYLESLRNMGLRSNQENKIRESQLPDSPRQTGNLEAGRYQPPAFFKDRFRAFHEGVSREN